ncbi:MAG TPA: proteasome-type protease [Steroidobacteraceae bacterium]|nr:proteasome-type protease [Steroidobacteraceae bacterium]HRX89051.1 proteasome-type protease [Steroidobacteraceae bacterium]
MTYCVAVAVNEGLVFLGDSRTNAGMDNVSTFRKLSVFETPGERAIVVMGAGNLAITQSVLGLLNDRFAAGEPSLLTQPSMAAAARLMGDAIREIHRRDGESLTRHGVEFNPQFILGGQIRGEPPRLFQIYSPGNFIETTNDTRYLQIGELKYGKPIIDRVIGGDTSLAAAAKCALISMDSTIRSNLSVGMPLDLAIVRADDLRITEHRRIEEHDEYFRGIRSGWGEALQQAFFALPDYKIPIGRGRS